MRPARAGRDAVQRRPPDSIAMIKMRLRFAHAEGRCEVAARYAIDNAAFVPSAHERDSIGSRTDRSGRTGICTSGE